jgi:hypothetical protein
VPDILETIAAAVTRLLVGGIQIERLAFIGKK